VSTPTEQSIHGFRDPNRNSLNAAREGPGIIGFDNEVEMVGLDAVVQHPEPSIARRTQCVLNNLEGPFDPE
jgi:hypothetical protein